MTWTGYIRLMNASDYVYAITTLTCVFNVILNKNRTKNNWLVNLEQWLINADNRISTETVMLMNSNGLTSSMADTDVFCVHPVTYLGSSMKIVPGQGTENDPLL